MKNKKITIILLIIFILFSFKCENKIYAADISISDIQSKAEKFISTGSASPKINEELALTSFLPIGQVLVFAATIILIIVAIIMGIKWITGSPEQQAKLKEELIGFVVAVIVIYGAVGIWAFSRSVMSGF